MTHSFLSLRPTAVSVKLADDNPKLVELSFLSSGLTLRLDMPVDDFEVAVSKWEALKRRAVVDDAHAPLQIGLFRKAP